MTAAPLSSVVGGPLAGLLLSLNSRLGLAGWQWLFLGEGLPAILLGIVVLGYLTDRPEHARWLAPDERTWLGARLRHKQEQCSERHRVGLRQALTHPTVWQLGLIYLLATSGAYGLTLWLPQIVKGLSSELSDFMISVISALPFTAGALGMVVVGAHSDRTGERCLHVAVPTLVGALGFAASAVLRSPTLVLLALAVAAFGTLGRNGPFWSLPSVFLTGSAAAGGIALINTVGQLGGFLGPYTFGLVKSATGDFAGGLLVLASLVLGSGLLALRLRHAPALKPVPGS
jgi:ACS family tartrate transporter-like MFS transporter